MRKRNNRIVFYLNDEELTALTDKVQKSKFPREKFIRITLANKRITEMPPVDYGCLVFEMRRAGQNLHRLLVIATANHFFEAADSLFSGMLFCVDCGSKLNYVNEDRRNRKKACFICSAYRNETTRCSSHYIREEIICNIILETMQRIFRSVQPFEDPFIAKQREQFGIEQKRELNARKRAYDKAVSRVKEIDALIQRMYEDNVKGKLSDERYATLSSSLETEQKDLQAKLPAMEEELNRQVDQEEGLQRFIAKAKQITDLQELTPELVHEFIEKIIVHEKKYLDGKRYQVIDIYFYGVGIIKELTPEEMEAEFQKLAKQEKSA
ncbi:MAG: DUF4368 domain-containing protein [Clostridia bacterium]|nr:DUF4368 domain-containing protein [Clostridia bacterium]